MFHPMVSMETSFGVGRHFTAVSSTSTLIEAFLCGASSVTLKKGSIFLRPSHTCSLCGESGLMAPSAQACHRHHRSLPQNFALTLLVSASFVTYPLRIGEAPSETHAGVQLSEPAKTGNKGARIN